MRATPSGVALSPGYYISEAASWTFTGDLEKVSERIGALLAASAPAPPVPGSPL
jgi:hypothetical protein